MEPVLRYVFFYKNGRQLPSGGVAKIHHDARATVVSEGLKRLVVEAPDETVGALLDRLPGWDAEPVTTVHVPSTLPKVRAPSRLR